MEEEGDLEADGGAEDVGQLREALLGEVLGGDGALEQGGAGLDGLVRSAGERGARQCTFVKSSPAYSRIHSPYGPSSLVAGSATSDLPIAP